VRTKITDSLFFRFENHREQSRQRRSVRLVKPFFQVNQFVIINFRRREKIRNVMHETFKFKYVRISFRTRLASMTLFERLRLPKKSARQRKRRKKLGF
jgi:hypothetical protein